jgi:hypothetical protein
VRAPVCALKAGAHEETTLGAAPGNHVATTRDDGARKGHAEIFGGPVPRLPPTTRTHMARVADELGLMVWQEIPGLLDHPVGLGSLARCRGSISRMSPREAVAILGRRFAEQASEEARCARDIRATVPLVADVLVREVGVRRVVLFGSVARGAARPDSDIDIALEGLPPGQTFHAMARAAEVAGRPCCSFCSST